MPVCDVIRHGPDELVDAILAYRQQAVSPPQGESGLVRPPSRGGDESTLKPSM